MIWYTKHPKDIIWQSRSDKHFQQRNSIKNQDLDEKAQLQSLKYFKKMSKMHTVKKTASPKSVLVCYIKKKKKKRASWHYESNPFSNGSKSLLLLTETEAWLEKKYKIFLIYLCKSILRRTPIESGIIQRTDKQDAMKFGGFCTGVEIVCRVN